MGDMAGFRDEKLPPFHRQATGIPSRKLRPGAGSCEQGQMFSEGRVLATKVSQLGGVSSAHWRLTVTHETIEGVFKAIVVIVHLVALPGLDLGR